MAKKYELPRSFNIAVVGLSGTEKEKGVTGVGKSCLCNRFVRPLADDYHVDHISVLSQTDFSGRVVNNDHFLYWGEVTKTSDEGAEFVFQVIEHTEFIDDSSFQTFKSGKHDPYYKRVTNTKLCSAEKLMYICKNQLGIEKEYEQKLLPDGKFNVDGFVCTFDVSEVQGRSIEKQVEFTVLLLSHLLKTKKPVVLATTKHEEARDLYVREAEKLLTRKEIRGTTIPLIETSAHENINVELAFVAVAQLIDRAKGRSKIVPFYDSARARKEVLDVATDAYQSLIRSQVTDYRAVWSSVNLKFSQNQDFLHYCEQFGQDAARNMFKRHVKKLKEEYIGRKMQMYIRVLPEVLGELLPDLASIGDGDWANVRERLKEHPDFHQYFLESPDEQRWQESDLVDSNETRIPYDILDTPEAEVCFEEHRAALDADEQRQELRQEFKELLEETGLVTPGKLLSEVRVLFLGRECCERLSEQDLKEIYQEHQREITERAKHNFQELLLEQASLFYYFASIGPGNVLTQEDFNKITEALQEDSRYKALDRLGQDRMLMILQHLGFVHGPIREHCPANPNCMDTVVDKIIAQKAHRPSSWSRNSQWLLETENNQLNLVLLGSGGLAERLANAIKTQCLDNTFEVEKVHYTLDFRIIDGDVGLPQNSFRTTNFRPHGCFCVYANPQTLEYIRDSLEKTLLSNLEQEDRLPFHGLPIVILFAADATINEKDLLFLREEGQNRAKNLQCPFIDVSSAYEDNSEEQTEAQQRFEFNSLNQALRSLIESIQRRAGLLQIYHQLPDHAINPDIRILMCMLCGDPYQVEHVLGPLLSHQCCFVTAPHSVTLETYLGESKRSVEVRVTSFHGANAFRDELVHGFILVYSTKRKASLATLGAFSNNIPNIPIQILAVSETDSAKDFFSSELSHQLITEGNAVADKLQAHFMTSTASMQQKTAFYTPFFKEVWERKPQIEKAFHMEDSDYSVDSQRTPVPPPVPSRQESYHIRSGSVEDGGDSEGLYEQLPTDSDGSTGAPLSPSDDSDLYASVFHPGEQQMRENGGDHLVKPSRVKNRRSLQAELYRQAFPSTESLDRSLSMKGSLGGGREPPPLPPARQHHHFTHDPRETDPHSGGGIDLTFPPPMSTFSSGGSSGGTGGGGGPSGGGSPPPSYHHSQMHYSPRLLPHPMTSHHAAAASLYATNRRRPPTKGASTEGSSSHHQKTLGPFSSSRFELKKSNSLKSSPGGNMPSAPSAPSLSGAGVFARNDLDVSDSVTDDDEEEDDDDTLSSGLSGYGAYPPPPEPAPPDLPPPRLKKASSVGQSHPAAGHHASRTSLNEGWAENRIFERDYHTRTEEWLDNEVYHTYHSERQKTAPPTRPKPNNKPKPGKLNLKQFENLTDAINRLSTNNGGGSRQGKHSHQVGATLAKMTGLSNAPLATPESIDLGTDYARVKDAVQVYGANPGDYSYSLVHNALSQDSKPHRVRSLARRPGNREAFDKAKMKVEQTLQLNKQPAEDETLLITNVGKGEQQTAAEKAGKKKEDRKKMRDDEKQEKRRQKEEERQKRQTEKKKKKTGNNAATAGGKGGAGAQPAQGMEDFVQSDQVATPLFVEKCIVFIEEEGLDSEGIYRVPGNRAHVDLLFQKFDEDARVSIRELDIPVNAVATALKDFFSKRLPPLLPAALMDELTDIAGIQDKSCRLFALRDLLKKLPDVNFQILKYVFQHFVKVAENCRLNSMDSKNLAICWWPTLLPLEFNDMLMFERMRPHLEDSVQTMIDQFRFLFCDQEEVVMV